MAYKTCCSEHMKQTVDDQFIDDGNLTLQTQSHNHTVVGEISRRSVLKTMMDYHGELVLQPLRNSQPVQVMRALAVTDHARTSESK